MLVSNNSVGIMVTETWHDDSVLGAEVQIPGYDIFRADRKGRRRGGAATYLSSELQCKLELSYSNSVLEALVIKCTKLDIPILCIQTSKHFSE